MPCTSPFRTWPSSTWTRQKILLSSAFRRSSTPSWQTRWRGLGPRGGKQAKKDLSERVSVGHAPEARGNSQQAPVFGRGKRARPGWRQGQGGEAKLGAHCGHDYPECCGLTRPSSSKEQHAAGQAYLCLVPSTANARVSPLTRWIPGSGSMGSFHYCDGHLLCKKQPDTRHHNCQHNAAGGYDYLQLPALLDLESRRSCECRGDCRPSACEVARSIAPGTAESQLARRPTGLRATLRLTDATWRARAVRISGL